MVVGESSLVVAVGGEAHAGSAARVRSGQLPPLSLDLPLPEHTAGPTRREHLALRESLPASTARGTPNRRRTGVDLVEVASTSRRTGAGFSNANPPRRRRGACLSCATHCGRHARRHAGNWHTGVDARRPAPLIGRLVDARRPDLWASPIIPPDPPPVPRRPLVSPPP